MPDTLDITERAKLAIHGLTSPLDPNDHYSLYWLVNFQNTPPIMRKEIYVNIGAKFRWALPFLRIITGSDLNNNVDQVWMDALLKDIGPDGLIYQRQGQQAPRYSLGGYSVGRLMDAMMIYYQRDSDKKWIDRIKAIVDRYNKLAVDKGDWAYFCADVFPLNAVPNKSCPVPIGVWPVDGVMGRTIQPLGQFYKLTGYQPAKELGDKFVNYVLHHSEYFGPEGQWLTDKLDPTVFPNREQDCHFGMHSDELLDLLDYAIFTENEELKKYCKKSFDWAKHRNSTIEGQSYTVTKIGFFLECLNPYYPTSEHCCVADMVAIALKLSAAGIGDYWDDAERWIRNQFSENQMIYADWTNRLKHPHWPRVPEGNLETNYRVAERNVGGFLSWVTANDGCQSGVMEGNQMYVSAPAVSIGIMHCCTANGARTLCYIWENIISWDDGKLTVNMLLNRASKWADIDSYIPYEGKVVLKIKEPLTKVLIRMPEWINSGSKDVVVTVNGSRREIAWEGRLAGAGSVQAGDILMVVFPISETVVARRVYGEPHETMIGGFEYDRLIFRGNTLVSIDPAGRNYSLYQRQYYRDKPRWIKVKRFISDEKIVW